MFDPNFLATRRQTVPIEIVTAFDAYLGYEEGDGAGGCGGDDPPVGYTQHRVEQHQHQESRRKNIYINKCRCSYEKVSKSLNYTIKNTLCLELIKVKGNQSLK